MLFCLVSIACKVMCCIVCCLFFTCIKFSNASKPMNIESHFPHMLFAYYAFKINLISSVHLKKGHSVIK